MSREHHLDLRRLLCPIPVIRTQNKIKECTVGDVLIITATDPGVKQDIPAWCRIHGHRLLNVQDQGAYIIITLQVCAA